MLNRNVLYHTNKKSWVYNTFISRDSNLLSLAEYTDWKICRIQAGKQRHLNCSAEGWLVAVVFRPTRPITKGDMVLPDRFFFNSPFYFGDAVDRRSRRPYRTVSKRRRFVERSIQPRLYGGYTRRNKWSSRSFMNPCSFDTGSTSKGSTDCSSSENSVVSRWSKAIGRVIDSVKRRVGLSGSESVGESTQCTTETSEDRWFGVCGSFLLFSASQQPKDRKP